MRFLKYLMPLIFITLLLVSGCSKNVSLYNTAKKQYKHGNLEAALQTNVQSLTIKPGYVKAQDLLKDIYPRLIRIREEKIAKLAASDDALKWDKLYKEYTELDAIQTKVKDLPRLMNPKTGEVIYFDFKDYNPNIRESKTNAAEYHYSSGIKLARSGNSTDIQKEAAKEFKLAQEFIPGYKDSASRYEQARKLAIKRIAIMAFEDKSGSKSKYGGIPEMLVDSIIGSLLQDKSASEFLEIITRDQINTVLLEQKLGASGLVDEKSSANVGMLLGAHEIMTGKILQINYVQPRTVDLEKKETANVTVSEETYIDVEGNERTRAIKGDVSCLYTKYTKTAGAQITASYTIVDVSTGRIKIQDNFTSEENWSDVWARKGAGDERALSPSTKALIAKSEPLPPSDVELVNRAVRKLSGMFISQIKNYVK
ncbi:MAG: CsgG/HfaB family protein [Candidatus Cloacimonadaceae bacterium]|nr:CsgG/HfaB family protein [Candidatus Cloacimonadaceae bacterium]